MIVRAVPSVDDLVTEHMKLVVLVVRTMRSMPCVKRLGDEAISVGRFALFKAAQGYDLSKGTLFKTYAETVIRNAVNKEAAKHAKSLGLHLVNPDALPDDYHADPIPEKPKRRRRRRCWNPYDDRN